MSIYGIEPAQRELREISRRYSTRETYRKADGTVRHKCFISYHAVDAPQVLQFVSDFEPVLIPRVVGLTDDDPLIDSDDSDYIVDTIREKYLWDTTITIVMIGRCTWSRRFVDAEVYSSLRAGKVNRVNGLMAIELKSVAGSSTLQARVADNYKKDKASYAKYWVYPSYTSTLSGWIEQAFKARLDLQHLIDNSRQRRKRSSPCP